MSGVLVVTGTDTGIGKTVVAAGLAVALGAHYWKPVQAGTRDGTDSDRAASLGVAQAAIVAEAYCLAHAASPHLAAQHEGVTIDPARLALPAVRPLIVEGAGGLMVPIRRDPPWLMIDQFAAWRAPVVLVARTGLGTINHSLLSLAALRARDIAIAGILFVGAGLTDVVGGPYADTVALVPALGSVACLGCLPRLDPLDAAALGQAMARHVDLAAIRAALDAAP
jgi:dethiobiotin synthetase